MQQGGIVDNGGTETAKVKSPEMDEIYEQRVLLAGGH